MKGTHEAADGSRSNAERSVPLWYGNAVKLGRGKDEGKTQHSREQTDKPDIQNIGIGMERGVVKSGPMPATDCPVWQRAGPTPTIRDEAWRTWAPSVSRTIDAYIF